MAGTTIPGIIVEGGAYRSMPVGLKETYTGSTKDAAKTGYAILMQGGTAVDAVEAAVCFLESDEHFNAGCGSLLNNDREVECDAMIMEGHTLKNGAVISGKYFLHPVSLAKEIMINSCHCAISGDGARAFAERQNFPICEPEELISELARAKLNVSYENYLEYVKYYYEGKPLQADTVSAVAIDCDGHLACALSTGGVAGKLKGRVGDAAMIGCGGYANETGAATVTGFGETIMKVTLAREVVFNMEKGKDVQQSAEDGLTKMKERVNGYGGVIAIDKDGNFGKHFTTKKMVWASLKENILQSGMEENEVEQERLD